MGRKRGNEVTRLADQAWDNLTSAASSGGDLAKSVGRQTRSLADEGRSKVSSGSKEARRRADAALDALAGKKPPRRWGWVLGAAAVGVAIGWVATAFGRRAVTAAQEQLAVDAQPADLDLYDEVTPAH